jgi:hypothetical protein
MVDKSLLEDPDYWRRRAEEARTIAEQMENPEAKQTMLEIAAGYDRMAQRAAERIAAEKPLKLN